MKHPAIIFDMDGVITNTEPLHMRAEFKVLDRYGIKPDKADWRGFQGRTTIAIFTILIERYGKGKDGLDPVKMKSEKIELYKGYSKEEGGLPTIPGSIEFIKKAKDYFDKTALATSCGADIQKLTFDHHDLWPYFDVVVNSDLVTKGKPDPELYLVAAEKLGVAPGDCIVLEDSNNGVKAGVAAGCTVIGITSNFPKEDLLDFGAKTTVDSYDELEERLRSGTLIK